MRKERGITLVSLVVTIIILIILAGVSINLILGENGIITKAKEAKTKTEQAKLNEEIALNELYTQLEAEGGEGFNGDNSNVYIEKLAEFKKAIADYIEEAGGIKPEYTAETITFGESIKGIVKEVTKNATATAEDIAEGKTAYVNGELITGTMANYAVQIGNGIYNGKDIQTIDIKPYFPNDYEKLSVDNFFIREYGMFNYTGYACSTQESMSLNYNNLNGTLSISRCVAQTSSSNYVALFYYLYCIY